MNTDEYNEIINGEETFKTIAYHLKMHQPVIIGWTDENSTHYDILFTLTAKRYGSQIQGGVRPETDLFVSIMRMGAFGFEVNDMPTHPSYVDEKLCMRLGDNITREKLAELINGVKASLLA